ncbi:hypothetical protein GCM10023194_58840 [Planotetraspora phitsanulokensis]|uniref:DarT domain-containing protein n=1 Tax=Planotetraspora phitsanulokensis TaxID=575192 RepID=A0A8J3U8N7_9ACTN|nr:DarT ssDNA thymidine ADP-ribosyltransferase family protein [Planotetraspora phitsanulokensis]GII40345.1 hypothetical protein Pph01_53480 [Planotetraspora phitsanulokensis]
MTDHAHPLDLSISEYVSGRQIQEILHFTTNKGLLGIFATGAVLSRDRLAKEDYIEHIYTPNCSDRLKDAAWTDYVNLSISRVNGRMLGVSKTWHATEDVWWAILSFDASLLVHPGVHFTTTNNTYSACVQRGIGVNSLAALFADSVEWGRYGSRFHRNSRMPASWTTDPQAEVLYPQQVPIGTLRAIYVREEEHIDTIRGWFPLFPKISPVPVEYKPEVFQ